jgi:hypothetical protein
MRMTGSAVLLINHGLHVFAPGVEGMAILAFHHPARLRIVLLSGQNSFGGKMHFVIEFESSRIGEVETPESEIGVVLWICGETDCARSGIRFQCPMALGAESIIHLGEFNIPPMLDMALGTTSHGMTSMKMVDRRARGIDLDSGRMASHAIRITNMRKGPAMARIAILGQGFVVCRQGSIHEHSLPDHSDPVDRIADPEEGNRYPYHSQDGKEHPQPAAATEPVGFPFEIGRRLVLIGGDALGDLFAAAGEFHHQYQRARTAWKRVRTIKTIDKGTWNRSHPCMNRWSLS